MISFEIPGRGTVTVDHVIFDFNGTLAEDGAMAAETASLAADLSARVHVMAATADTFGTAAQVLAAAGIPVAIVKNAQDKERLVQSLAGGVAAVGNGANDVRMFQASALSVCVLGPEGAAVSALMAADIVVPSIKRAIELFTKPARVTATLRE
jgi:soluble P-type ATPase